jgi:hypothetical protein
MSHYLALGRTAPFLLLVGLAACAPGGELGEEELTQRESEALGVATIHFGADWSERVEGVLAEGGVVHLRYDEARLPDCASVQQGTPQYAITAHARVGGETKSVVVAGLGASADPVIELEAAGELEVWFEATSRYGCHAFDSDFGQNYRFVVVEEARKPDWMGNAAFVMARVTCDGPCDSSRRALEPGFWFDSWARQRAAITSLYFDVWEPGVTDFDNADLWKQLDAQLHYRFAGQEGFTTEYVDFFRRVGNDARYEVPLRGLDPFPGHYVITDPSECPAVAIEPSADGATVSTTLEYYFTVNGKELRPAGGGTYTGRFDGYRHAYEICIAP